MNNEKFRRLDESVARVMKSIAPRKISRKLMEGFSGTVAEKIRERENARLQPRPAFGLRILVPVFAVFLLFCTVIFRGYPLMSGEGAGPLVRTSISEMADEVSALKAVGVWNEEDDKAFFADEAAVSREAEAA